MDCHPSPMMQEQLPLRWFALCLALSPSLSSPCSCCRWLAAVVARYLFFACSLLLLLLLFLAFVCFRAVFPFDFRELELEMRAVRSRSLIHLRGQTLQFFTPVRTISRSRYLLEARENISEADRKG